MFAKRFLCLTSALAMCAFASYAADSAINADKQGVDAACASDAATMGCGNMKAGKGLVRCMTAYKKANPGFKHTSGCKAALDRLHADKAASGAGHTTGQPAGR